MEVPPRRAACAGFRAVLLAFLRRCGTFGYEAVTAGSALVSRKKRGERRGCDLDGLLDARFPGDCLRSGRFPDDELLDSHVCLLVSISGSENGKPPSALGAAAACSFSTSSLTGRHGGMCKVFASWIPFAFWTLRVLFRGQGLDSLAGRQITGPPAILCLSHRSGFGYVVSGPTHSTGESPCVV